MPDWGLKVPAARSMTVRPDEDAGADEKELASHHCSVLAERPLKMSATVARRSYS
jgi:hypothetical protein